MLRLVNLKKKVTFQISPWHQKKSVDPLLKLKILREQISEGGKELCITP